MASREERRARAEEARGAHGRHRAALDRANNAGGDLGNPTVRQALADSRAAYDAFEDANARFVRAVTES